MIGWQKQNKTKKAKILVMMLIFTISAVLIFLMLRSKVQEDGNAQFSGQIQIQNRTRKKQQDAKTFATVFFKGKIVSFRSYKLEIENGGVVSILDVSEDLVVYKKNGEWIEKKEAKDLRENTSVAVELNIENSVIVGIEIL